MKLLQIINEMAIRKRKRKKKSDDDQLDSQRNFVAKHAQGKSGAGQHQDKQGQKASRNRQKKQWRKEEGL